MSDHVVDPFIGTGVTDLGDPEGVSATWWWPKPQVGNTHPGATFPLGMVSACAYSGAYPTGYGQHQLATEGVPPQLFDRLAASGFTHFQQSGTGAIRKYYNYLRTTPMLDPLDDVGNNWNLEDEHAEPGYYRTKLSSGIECELTVGPKSAVHRYTFPEHDDARLVIDFSLGGLAIEHGRTVPVRAHIQSLGHGVSQGELMVEGVPLAVHIECDAPEWRQMLWYDRRLMPGGTQLEFDYIRPTTLRPFGMLYRGPTKPGQTIEISFGFSLRGTEQAKQNLVEDVASEQPRFQHRRDATTAVWCDHLETIETGATADDRKTVFETALYHSLIKPCFAQDESPFWDVEGPFVFDICTLWDIYKTQLPLLAAIEPERAVELAVAQIQTFEQEGNFPIGYRMARGSDRFFRQGSSLMHTFLADLCAIGVTGIDWDWALVHMETDLRRNYGEEYIEKGVVHPVSHTLDLATAYHCTAKVARHLGDAASAEQLETLSGSWVNAFDPSTGLLIDSTFYEGGKWNYSFRLLHDMARRIDIAGGENQFCELLDQFFGIGQPPVKQPSVNPTAYDMQAGYALNRFEGLNNEPDMETPWAYHYVGRPDRTAEVVHAAINNQFGLGRGGLPGNDDSGGLSAWYVWASLGLFPVAGQNLFLLHPPSFAQSRLKVGSKKVTIEADGFVEPQATRPPQYVQSVEVDGEPLDRTWISGTELRAANVIKFSLGDQRSSWGKKTRPPSLSTQQTIKE